MKNKKRGLKIFTGFCEEKKQQKKPFTKKQPRMEICGNSKKS